MDLSAVSLAASSLDATSSQAAVAVTRKALDITAQQDASLVALVDQSRGLGQNLNVTA